MDWTVSDFKQFLEDSDDYDALTFDLIEEMLGPEEAQEFLNEFDLELEEGEISWKSFPNLDNFEDLCRDDNFIALITAYFDCDEIIFIDE